MNARRVAEQLVGAIDARDWERIERCLAADVRFRALVPERVREHGTAAETVERLRLWWSDADEFEVVRSEVEDLPGLVRLAYRIRCRENGEWYLVEQHGYAQVTGGRVTDLSLVCSGFRPVQPDRA